mgnify:FL=1
MENLWLPVFINSSAFWWIQELSYCSEPGTTTGFYSSSSLSASCESTQLATGSALNLTGFRRNGTFCGFISTKIDRNATSKSFHSSNKPYSQIIDWLLYWKTTFCWFCSASLKSFSGLCLIIIFKERPLYSLSTAISFLLSSGVTLIDLIDKINVLIFVL